METPRNSSTSQKLKTVFRFLVACTRLYKPLCRSVRQSVCPSLIVKTSQIGTIRLFERWRQSVTTRQAPDVVYTVLLLPLLNSTQPNLPCIRPCCFIQRCFQKTNGLRKGSIIFRTFSKATQSFKLPENKRKYCFMYALIAIMKINKHVLFQLIQYQLAWSISLSVSVSLIIP